MPNLPVILITAAMAVAAGAAEYQIDPAHSEITFKIKHLGINTVTGRFDKFSGTFSVDPKDVKATTGNATIDAASVNTNNAKRDGHLKSPDFFDAAKYPEITFASKEVKDVNLADSTCTLVGDLTMHGVTHPVQLKVKGGGLAKDPMGAERAAFTATGVLNRKDWGLTWNKALETGGLVVGEEVKLEMGFEGIKKGAGPAAPKNGAAPKK